MGAAPNRDQSLSACGLACGAMVVTAGEGGSSESQGGPLRLLGYLKANKNVGYVLAIMVLVHLSNQYDRQVVV